MFHALARFSMRFRWIIVVVWVLAALDHCAAAVVLFDRWNWWPSRLWRQSPALSEQASTIPVPEAPTDQTDPVGRKERP